MPTFKYVKRAQEKINKDSGKAYLTRSGFLRPGKSLRNPCDSNCRHQCNSKITEAQRNDIFCYFYGLQNLTEQWKFLAQLMDRTTPKKTIRLHLDGDDMSKLRRNRKSNIHYYLPIEQQEKRIKVCSTMFMATFDITQSTVKTIMRKTNGTGVLFEPDMRGYHGPKIVNVKSMNKN